MKNSQAGGASPRSQKSSILLAHLVNYILDGGIVRRIVKLLPIFDGPLMSGWTDRRASCGTNSLGHRQLSNTKNIASLPIRILHLGIEGTFRREEGIDGLQRTVLAVETWSAVLFKSFCEEPLRFWIEEKHNRHPDQIQGGK